MAVFLQVAEASDLSLPMLDGINIVIDDPTSRVYLFYFISRNQGGKVLLLQSVCIISELLDYRHSHWLHFIIRLCLFRICAEFMKSISDVV